MAGLSESVHFQALWVSALQFYEEKTGIPLEKHPLAVQLQNCPSVESISAVLERQARAFCHYRKNSRIMKAFETTVSVLTPLSAAAPLVSAVGKNVFPPAQAIQTALSIVLDAAKGVTSSFDALADLLESFEHFIQRLKIYTKIPPTPALDEVVVKIMAELISMLALVTKKLKKGRPIKDVKKFFEHKDIAPVLQRLDRLTQYEHQVTATQTLGVVHSFLQNMKEFMGDGNATIGSFQEALKSLHQVLSDINKDKRNEVLRKIRVWLSPPNTREKYNTSLELRHRTTGSWFLNCDTISKWKESGPSSVLWIHGKPGAGKTVLCSTITKEIEDSAKSGLVSLAMFYYDHTEDQDSEKDQRNVQKKYFRGLLSSVLDQLCRQSDSYCNILSDLHSEHDNGFDPPSNEALVSCLKSILKLPREATIFLIVDGLDECPNTSSSSFARAEVLKLLKDLIELQLPNLRICVTSRLEADIEAALAPLVFRSISLHDQREQNEDIEKYIKWFVNTNEKMQDWSSEFKRLVIDSLTERADGMFQWVRCQLEYLVPCLPAYIKDALKELPATLDGTYRRVLRGIEDANREFVKRLLPCVAVAPRPLRIEELAEIIAFDFKSGSIPKFNENWRHKNPVQAVLSTCSTLLSVVKVNGYQIVKFSHNSVKEFLTSTRFGKRRHGDALSGRFHISITPAHDLLARACLGILLHLDGSITEDSLKNFPLAEYAARYWFEHARLGGMLQNAARVQGIKQLFDPSKPHLAIWLWIWDPTDHSHDRTQRAKRPLPPTRTPLHYAAFCGLQTVVKAMTEEHPQDVNARCPNDDSTPLHLASQEGHLEVARVLVQDGANVSDQDRWGWTPLHWASKCGHVDLTRFLVEKGADVTAIDKERTNPLYLASKKGHKRDEQLLIKQGADRGDQAVSVEDMIQSQDNSCQATLPL